MKRTPVKDPRRIRPVVTIKVLPDPISPALRNNLFLEGGRHCLLPWYQERVKREVLKYLRHETTNYDALRSRYGCHSTGSVNATTAHQETTIEIIRARVAEAIAKAYPSLEADLEAAAVRIHSERRALLEQEAATKLWRSGAGLVLWHRTPASAAILANGFRETPQRYVDERGEPVGIAGVYVSNRPLDANEGAKGRDLLKVTLRASEAEIDQYEIKDDEGTYREWCVPAALLNERATVVLVDEFADEGEG